MFAATQQNKRISELEESKEEGSFGNKSCSDLNEITF
jgi:hypothetical protein